MLWKSGVFLKSNVLGQQFFLKKGHFMLYLLHCYYCRNSYLQLHLPSCCFFAGVSFLEKLVTAFAYSLCRALISFEEVPNDINESRPVCGIVFAGGKACL